ncbi:ENASE acetylglucosaminidase, partial [Smithornis capensis]|nr:ENASE acetylglucosaminidase [Smithornis capensis]
SARYFDTKTTEPISFFLSGLEELLAWQPNSNDDFNISAVPLAKRQPPLSSRRPRTLVCHDMRGGYLEDRYVLGRGEMWQWGLMSQTLNHFCFWVMCFLTARPRVGRDGWAGMGAFGSWCPCSATLLRLGCSGVAQCHSSAQLSGVSQAPAQPRSICQRPFCTAQPSSLPAGSSRAQLHATPMSSTTGATSTSLSTSATTMSPSHPGMGLGVPWARRAVAKRNRTARTLWVLGHCGCWPGSSWPHSALANMMPRAATIAGGSALTSAVAFRFWGSLAEYLPTHSICTLPLATSFSLGMGTSRFLDGKEEESGPWYDLSVQEIQPLYPEQQGRLSTGCCLQDAWCGGSSLRLQGTIPPGEERVSVRLFSLQMPAPPKLYLTLLYKLEGPQPDDFTVALEVTTWDSGTCHEGNPTSLPEPNGRHHPRFLPAPPPGLAKLLAACHRGSHGWTSRCYELELQDCSLRDLSVIISRQQPSPQETSFSCLLGEVRVLDTASVAASPPQVQGVTASQLWWQ